MSVVQTRLITSSWLEKGSQLVADECGLVPSVPLVRWKGLRHQSVTMTGRTALMWTPTPPGSTTWTPLGTIRPGESSSSSRYEPAGQYSDGIEMESHGLTVS